MARWLLEISFQASPRIAVTLELRIVVLGAQNLSCRRPSASALVPRVTILGDHRSSSKDTWVSSIRFAGILRGLRDSMVEFSGQQGFSFCRIGFHAIFRTDVCIEVETLGALKTRFSYRML